MKERRLSPPKVPHARPRPPNANARALLLGLLYGGLAACQGPALDPADFTSPAVEDATRKRLRAMGFRDDTIEDRGDFYVVEGDIMFPKEEGLGPVEELAQKWIGTFASREVIRVRIDPSVTADYITATESAMQQWNDARGVSFSFQRVASDPQDVLIKMNTAPGTACAIASYPTSWGSPGQLIQIHQNQPTCPPTPVMLHELGHVIGLKHTNNCFQEEGFGPCLGVPQVGGDDDLSIMINPASASRNALTSADILAAMSLYPASLAAASRNANATEAFMVDYQQNLRRYYWSGATASWHNHGKPSTTFADQIAAVSWTPGVVSVFGIGTDRRMRQFRWNGSAGTWSSYIPPADFGPGQGFLGQVTAVSWAPGVYGVFGLGEDGRVKEFYWNGSTVQWIHYTQQFPGGLRFAGPLAAVSWTGRPHVYGLGGVPAADGSVRVTTLLDMWWDGSAWQWSDLRNQIGSSLDTHIFRGQISAVEVAGNPRLYGIGRDGNFKELYRSGPSWLWRSVAIPSVAKMTGPAAASSWSSTHIEVFGMTGGFGSEFVLFGGDLTVRVDDNGTRSWANALNGWFN
jgi:hypothetical protein